MAPIDIYFSYAMSRIKVRHIALWLCVAAASAAVCLVLRKKGKIRRATVYLLPALVFYLQFILMLTLFNRERAAAPAYTLDLFWSYRAAFHGTPKLMRENFWNVVLFIPAGVLAAALLPRRRGLAALLLLFSSFAIELLQLVTHLGLFELDDIVHNALGGLIGIGVCALVEKIKNPA